MEKEFSKGTDNYPPTVERSIHLLNAHKINFEYTKKGVNLMSDEEEVEFIEFGEDGEVDPDRWKKAMS